MFEVPNLWQASGTQLTFNFTFARLALKVSASLGSYLSSLMGKASKVAAIIQYLPPPPPPIHTHTHIQTHTHWWPWFSRNSIKPTHLTEPFWMNYFYELLYRGLGLWIHRSLLQGLISADRQLCPAFQPLPLPQRADTDLSFVW